jgi:membrane protease YdiL (CAAX protease family)
MADQVRRWNDREWWPVAVTLVISTLGLGAALLIPVAFSDPNGVDPYVARLAVASLLMAIASLVLRRLAPSRAVLLALGSVATTYTLLTAGPQILVDVFGTGLYRSPVGTFDAQVFWASLAQAVLTLVIAAVSQRFVDERWRPRLRFGVSVRGVLLGVVSSALLIGLALALPAELLGRYGLAPVAIARDFPWLGPANALEAFAQEVQFRGILMGSLERVMSPLWANVSQAAVFGLAHLAISYGGPEAPFVPITFLVGLAFGWLVQRTNSIWPAVIVHAVADIALQFGVMPGLYGF